MPHPCGREFEADPERHADRDGDAEAEQQHTQAAGPAHPRRGHSARAEAGRPAEDEPDDQVDEREDEGDRDGQARPVR